jgi:hypothetical protein
VPSPRLPSTILGVVAAFVIVPSAHAGPLVAAAPDCGDQVSENPFRPWADPMDYVLVPNGIAEGGRHWDLDGAAAVESGNERFYVHGRDEERSIALPAGSSATTGAICVGIEHPTLRFFARNRGSALSVLLVEVLFEDAWGRVRSLPIGALSAGREWAPTLPLPIVVNLLPLLPGQRTAVAFRFTPYGGGDWNLDDVYVDPWRHG